MTMNADLRRRQLATIHVLRKQLAMDEDTYRAMLFTVSGDRSAAALTASGRNAAIEHMTRLKLALLTASDRSAYPGRPHTTDDNEQLRKIEAFLAEAGRPWTYAVAVCKRVCKKERLEWCTPAELGKVIAALTYDARRNGRKTG
jgi:phage gp16-like protein